MMLTFCYHSLFRAYGHQFLREVALRHPVRTSVATLRYAVRGEKALGPARMDSGARPIVGVGFCLKPMAPACPSGRFNHDCAMLDRGGVGEGDLPMPCRECVAGRVGRAALRGGAAFYIMTSAMKILEHLYLPAIRERRYTDGLFGLCNYSFGPFTIPLLIARMNADLVGFQEGDCRDYPTWVRADEGDKPDRTCFRGSDVEALLKRIPAPRHTAWRKAGCVYYPEDWPADYMPSSAVGP